MFEIGDTIVRVEDKLQAYTYTVVAITTGEIVYARSDAHNFLRAMRCADCQKVEACREQTPS